MESVTKNASFLVIVGVGSAVPVVVPTSALIHTGTVFLLLWWLHNFLGGYEFTHVAGVSAVGLADLGGHVSIVE